MGGQCGLLGRVGWKSEGGPRGDRGVQLARRHGARLSRCGARVHSTLRFCKSGRAPRGTREPHAAHAARTPFTAREARTPFTAREARTPFTAREAREVREAREAAARRAAHLLVGAVHWPVPVDSDEEQVELHLGEAASPQLAVGHEALGLGLVP
eukprot:1876249-Prymnesium_polylepis.1